MRCPSCGAAELVHDTRDITHTYKGQTPVIAATTGDFCPACDESIFDMAESRRVMKLMNEFSKRVNASTADPAPDALEGDAANCAPFAPL